MTKNDAIGTPSPELRAPNSTHRPIGIFDSGVGGLTVFREIRKHFTTEDIVYFGDTARVPYGSKSKHTVIEYSIQNARFLVSMGAKIIVVACNTASAVALATLQETIDVPVVGVINAGAKEAVAKTKTGKIGVIGTDGTINSHAYQNAIRDLNPDIQVIEKACPLFVALAEEGWSDHHITKQVAEIYLADLLTQGVDTLVLGCTHYPILKNTIRVVCGDEVELVDSAEAICSDIRPQISDLRPQTSDFRHNVYDYFYVSDNEEKFRKIAKAILDIRDINLHKVRMGEVWYF